MHIVIKLDKRRWEEMQYTKEYEPTTMNWYEEQIVNGIPLPKGHGRLKDEDEIIKAIEDRVKFLKKNDETFMRLRKDIDILGCIPKICCEVPTIIEADKAESEEV